eukprot:15459609-Alexandrium_andersonii.AAC.1
MELRLRKRRHALGTEQLFHCHVPFGSEAVDHRVGQQARDHRTRLGLVGALLNVCNVRPIEALEALAVAVELGQAEACA